MLAVIKAYNKEKQINKQINKLTKKLMKKLTKYDCIEIKLKPNISFIWEIVDKSLEQIKKEIPIIRKIGIGNVDVLIYKKECEQNAKN